MNRRIQHCRFNVVSFNGTTTNAINGFPTNVNVYSGSYAYRPYYYTGSAFDEALNGSLRSQLGGYRFEAVLSWDRLINSTPLLAVLNNAYTTTNAEITVQFFPDASNTTVFENVIISDSVWTSTIDGQHVRQPLSITLTGKEIRSQIPAFYMI
jgi:hypothetical protein